MRFLASLLFGAIAILSQPSFGHASDRFFVITDSHGVGALGEELTSKLRKRPDTQFVFVASGGSAPLQWVNNNFDTTCGYREDSSSLPTVRRCHRQFHTPRLKALFKEAGPKLRDERRVAVIVLGTNFMDRPNHIDDEWQIASTVRLLVDAAQGADRCIWVGPPEMPYFGDEKVQYRFELLKISIERAAHQTGRPPCELIDSRTYAHYPAFTRRGPNSIPDGVHYHLPASYWKFAEGEIAARVWAQGVFSEVETLLGR